VRLQKRLAWVVGKAGVNAFGHALRPWVAAGFADDTLFTLDISMWHGQPLSAIHRMTSALNAET
jgi:hypothetical protein